MNERLRKLMERRAALVADMRGILDNADREERDLTAEERGNYDRAETDLSALESDIQREQRQAERENALHISANGTGGNPNPNLENHGGTGLASAEYRSNFEGYIRGTGFERRALQIGTDSEGGYLCPDEFERRLIDVATQENVVRPLATVIRSASGDRNIPVVSSHGSASWIDEEGSFSESDDAFTQVVLGAHKVGMLVKVSEELMNDSAFDMQTYLTREFGRRISAAEETAFLTGNGTKKPTGLCASATTAVTTAANNAITADNIFDIVYALKGQYRKKASFIMNDATVKHIRTIKDGNGQYIWEPSMQLAQPDRLLGFPVHTSSAMATIASSAKVILFGDYSYYWISDRQGTHIQRLNELYAANGQVGFRGWARVDGKLTVSEAVQMLVMHA